MVAHVSVTSVPGRTAPAGDALRMGVATAGGVGGTAVGGGTGVIMEDG